MEEGLFGVAAVEGVHAVEIEAVVLGAPGVAAEAGEDAGIGDALVALEVPAFIRGVGEGDLGEAVPGPFEEGEGACIGGGREGGGQEQAAGQQPADGEFGGLGGAEEELEGFFFPMGGHGGDGGGFGGAAEEIGEEVRAVADGAAAAGEGDEGELFEEVAADGLGVDAAGGDGGGAVLPGASVPDGEGRGAGMEVEELHAAAGSRVTCRWRTSWSSA